MHIVSVKNVIIHGEPDWKIVVPDEAFHSAHTTEYPAPSHILVELAIAVPAASSHLT